MSTGASRLPSATISAVGLILNNSMGRTLVPCFVACAKRSDTVKPSLNLPRGSLSLGDSVWGVVTGEVDQQHYFFEQNLTSRVVDPSHAAAV